MLRPVRSATTLLRVIQAVRAAQVESELLGIPVALVIPSNSTALTWARFLGACMTSGGGSTWDGLVLSSGASEVLVSSERGVIPSGVKIEMFGWEDELNADRNLTSALRRRCA